MMTQDTTGVEYTPGPWRATEGQRAARIVGADGSIITVIAPEDGMRGVANARLIAAAPALLEALERVTAAFDSVMAHYSKSMPMADNISRTGDLAAGYAAIAAARGEAVQSS